MKIIELHMPAKIYHGEHSLHRLDQVIPGQLNKVLVVTGKVSAEKYGYLGLVRDRLQVLHSEMLHFHEISPNPRIEEVDKAVSLCQKESVDLVIGLGGGSALDTAKAIAAMFYVDGKTGEVLSGQKQLAGQRLPLVLIPTTAGTGSEASMGAILSDQQNQFKSGIRGKFLLPDITLVDPELTYSLPRSITMETGFDVLCHGIETFLSTKSNPVTEIFSLHAVNAVFKYLPRLSRNLGDTTARQKMSYASLLMGINLANSSTCLPHRLQYPVGALTDTSHARGLAALYPSWLRSSSIFNREKIMSLEKSLPLPIGRSLSDAVADLLEETGLKTTLKDLGINSSLLPKLRSKVTGSLDSDPVAAVMGIVDHIYRESL